MTAVQGTQQPARVPSVLPEPWRGPWGLVLPTALPAPLPIPAQAAGCREESLQNSDYAGAPIQTSSDNLYVSILSVKENTQTPPFTRGASNLAAKHCILVIYLQLYFASCSFFFFFLEL